MPSAHCIVNEHPFWVTVQVEVSGHVPESDQLPPIRSHVPLPPESSPPQAAKSDENRRRESAARRTEAMGDTVTRRERAFMSTFSGFRRLRALASTRFAAGLGSAGASRAHSLG